MSFIVSHDGVCTRRISGRRRSRGAGDDALQSGLELDAGAGQHADRQAVVHLPRRRAPAGRVGRGALRRRQSPWARCTRSAPARISRRDRRLIYGAALLRGLAAGAISVLAAVYLAKRGFPADDIGIVLSAGMAGVLAGTVYGTVPADRVGRRRSLVAAGPAGRRPAARRSRGSIRCGRRRSPRSSGMLNTQGFGSRRGAGAGESRSCRRRRPTRERTRVFAWYNALAGRRRRARRAARRPAGGAARSAATGRTCGAYDATMLASTPRSCSRRAAALCVVCPRGDRARGGAAARRPAAAAERRGMLVRASRGFSPFDSVRRRLPHFLAVVVLLLRALRRATRRRSACSSRRGLLNAVSHLGAAWLAGRIGLVNTMVFTHIPSSLLLVTVAFRAELRGRGGALPSAGGTRRRWTCRPGSRTCWPSCHPAERTLASGVTNLVRLAGWAVAPAFAGAAMHAGAIGLPLVIGAAMKIGYDLLLWVAFRRVQPPEER